MKKSFIHCPFKRILEKIMFNTMIVLICMLFCVDYSIASNIDDIIEQLNTTQSYEGFEEYEEVAKDVISNSIMNNGMNIEKTLDLLIEATIKVAKEMGEDDISIATQLMSQGAIIGAIRTIAQVGMDVKKNTTIASKTIIMCVIKVLIKTTNINPEVVIRSVSGGILLGVIEAVYGLGDTYVLQCLINGAAEGIIIGIVNSFNKKYEIIKHIKIAAEALIMNTKIAISKTAIDAKPVIESCLFGIMKASIPYEFDYSEIIKDFEINKKTIILNRIKIIKSYKDVNFYEELAKNVIRNPIMNNKMDLDEIINLLVEATIKYAKEMEDDIPTSIKMMSQGAIVGTIQTSAQVGLDVKKNTIVASKIIIMNVIKTLIKTTSIKPEIVIKSVSEGIVNGVVLVTAESSDVDIMQDLVEGAVEGMAIGVASLNKDYEIGMDEKKSTTISAKTIMKSAIEVLRKTNLKSEDVIKSLSKAIINGVFMAAHGSNNLDITQDLIGGASEGIATGIVDNKVLNKQKRLFLLSEAAKACILGTKSAITGTNIEADPVIEASISGVSKVANIEISFWKKNIIKEPIFEENQLFIKKEPKKRFNINPPMVKIQSPKNDITVYKPQIKLSVKIESSDATTKYNNIKIEINDQEVQKKQGTQENFASTTIQTYFVDLVENKNKIKVIVTDSNNLTSHDTITVFRASNDIKGNLYFLSVGVNKLKQIPNNDLDFAAKDANDMANLMKQMKGKLYKDVNVYLYTDESSKKPTADNIVDALYTHLSQATKDDTVMIYLAGHGVTINDNQYIFLSQDSKMTGNQNYQMSSVLKWSDVNGALKNIKCTKIMILDTCFTGGVNIEPLLTETIKNKIIVFYSTSKSQRAKECVKFKNGCFTHAIIQALNNDMPADKNHDNKVYITELKDYVYTQLKQTSPEQTPDISLPVGGSNLIMYAR